MKFGSNKWVFLIAASIISGCGSDSGGVVDAGDEQDNLNPPQAEMPTAATARYRVTFDATWSETSHPVNFPGPTAHFSSLIGAVHNEQIVIWEEGQFATPGIEQMAETGATASLTQELDLATVDGTVESVIAGGGINQSPDQVSVEFSVSRDYPLVTLVTMIAPSPDWFVGVHGQTMLGGDGSFVDQLVIDLPAYDAGTDDGTQYTSANLDADPPQSIQLVTSAPTDSDFEFGLPILGQFTFERIDP
jgi:hypothetical protein